MVHEILQLRLSLPFQGLGLVVVVVVWETASFEGKILLLCSCFCFEVTEKIFHFHLLNMESHFHSRRQRRFYEMQ